MHLQWQWRTVTGVANNRAIAPLLTWVDGCMAAATLPPTRTENHQLTIIGRICAEPILLPETY